MLLMALRKVPHPEKAAKRPSRRTHRVDPAVHRLPQNARAAKEASALRAVAADRFGVGRIDAHVDALLPAALQGIDDVERHPADVLDLDLDPLAVLQRAEPLVIGAAGE